ncbi:MAG TPA: SDR family NAD(P)-dependent oxidoreductase [Terriglobia bacterium]|nr:SDR family NAD(P)-dependent oxidoreductase [Terriglobia bacterium]
MKTAGPQTEPPPSTERRSNEPGLAGKVVAVVGGSGGIGFAIAQAAARAGATVAIIARSAERLNRAGKTLDGALAIRADMTREAQALRAFRELAHRCGRLDALVNSAGTFTYKPFERTTIGDWRLNLDANLTSVFLATRAALALLVKTEGQVVNILSISSRHAFAQCSAYTAAKFGALGLTRVLAEELRSKGIRVSAILPGATNTRLVRAFGFPVDRERLVQPEDVAQAVLTALLVPRRATVGEIVVTPSGGAL